MPKIRLTIWVIYDNNLIIIRHDVFQTVLNGVHHLFLMLIFDVFDEISFKYVISHLTANHLILVCVIYDKQLK